MRVFVSILGTTLVAISCNPRSLHERNFGSNISSGEVPSSGVPNGCQFDPSTGRLMDVPIGGGISGTFRLYVDVSRDFDRAQPTVIEILDGQQPQGAQGVAETTKQRFHLNGNVIRVEHRGMPPCSQIDFAPLKTLQDWAMLSNIFSSERVLEDIEYVRKSLLGDTTKVAVFGSSGGGVLAAQFAARFPGSVSRVAMGISSSQLSQVYKTSEKKFWAEIASIGGDTEVQKRIPADGHLEPNSTDPTKVTSVELLWELVQFRYLDKTFLPRGADVIASLAQNNSSEFLRWKDKLQVQSAAPYSLAEIVTSKVPFCAVRLYELNRHSENPRVSPIARSMLPTIEPLLAAEEKGLIKLPRIDLREQLRSADAEFLLVGGRWDHVMPWEEIVEDQKFLPTSRVIIFDDTHGMTQYKPCLVTAFSNFLNSGLNADGLVSPSAECTPFYQALSSAR